MRAHGLLGLVQWRAAAAAAERGLAERFEPFEVQALLGITALLDGCGWCSVGHLYAANLIYLREYGMLLPLDERDVARLQRMRDPDLRMVLLSSLVGPDMERLRGALERLFALKLEGEAPGEEDGCLVELIAAWGAVTRCSVTAEWSGEVPPLSPMVSWDLGLIQRYRQQRERRAA